MTLPVFRLLMISATFVLCSVFAGNCRAETDLPCVMINKTKVVEKEGHICFSIKPLPACSESCLSSESVVKHVKFHCTRADKPLSDKRANMELDILIPVRCEAAFPAVAPPGTTP